MDFGQIGQGEVELISGTREEPVEGSLSIALSNGYLIFPVPNWTGFNLRTFAQ